MRIVVVGGTGLIGRRVRSRLAEVEGLTVVPASRASGVDALTGAGLDAAFAHADAVLDVTTVRTLSATRAVAAFGAMSRHVVTAAEQAGVGHLVLLSVLNAARPELHGMGHLRGKAEQERIVATAKLPVTVVATSQWYEFVPALLDQARLGPLSFVPHFRSAPTAAATAADLLARTVLDGPPAADRARRELAGPEDLDLYDLARVLAEREGRRVLPLPVPGATQALAGGAALPGPGVERLGPTWEQWSANR